MSSFNFRLRQQILIKISNTKFHENLSSSSQTDTCGRKDEHKEGNTRLSTFTRMRLYANQAADCGYSTIHGTDRNTIIPLELEDRIRKKQPGFTAACGVPQSNAYRTRKEAKTWPAVFTSHRTTEFPKAGK